MTASTNKIIDSAVKQLAICDKILSIAQSHQHFCTYTKLNREQLLPKIIANKKQLNLNVPNGIVINDMSSGGGGGHHQPNEFINDMKRLEMWRCLCVLMSPDSTRIVEFAKRVPGFKSLGQNEQVVLVKAHFFKCWLLRITPMLLSTSELRESSSSSTTSISSASSKFSNPNEQVFLTFESGHCISRDQLELVYDVKKKTRKHFISISIFF